MPQLTTAQLEAKQAEFPEKCDNCHKEIDKKQGYYLVEVVEPEIIAPNGLNTQERASVMLCSSWCLYEFAIRNHAKKNDSQMKL